MDIKKDIDDVIKDNNDIIENLKMIADNNLKRVYKKAMMIKTCSYY